MSWFFELNLISLKLPGIQACRLQRQTEWLHYWLPDWLNNDRLGVTVNVSLKRWVLGAKGGWGFSQKDFIRVGSAPKSNPLPFYTPFLTEKVPVLYTFYWQNETSLTYLIKSTYYLDRNHRLPHLSYTSISEIPTLYYVWILLVMTHPNLDSRVFPGIIARLWPERLRRRLHGFRLKSRDCGLGRMEQHARVAFIFY